MALTGYEVITYTAGPWVFDPALGSLYAGTIPVPAGKRALGATSELGVDHVGEINAHISADGTSVAWRVRAYSDEFPNATVIFHVTVADVQTNP